MIAVSTGHTHMLYRIRLEAWVENAIHAGHTHMPSAYSELHISRVVTGLLTCSLNVTKGTLSLAFYCFCRYSPKTIIVCTNRGAFALRFSNDWLRLSIRLTRWAYGRTDTCLVRITFNSQVVSLRCLEPMVAQDPCQTGDRTSRWR